MNHSHSMNVGIIGAGLIGNKRAAALPKDSCRLVAVSDLRKEPAQKLASSYQAEVEEDPWKLIQRKDIQIIIIATSNDSIASYACAALEAGKHVLIEKPGGRNPSDLSRIISSADRSKGILRVGFNHRFHPGLQKAKEMAQKEGFGPLMYIRAKYGHGGRLGYDQEWRANPELSGGGELLDQGVHLIDLCRWLGGEFELEFGRAKTFFWNMPVEDNGFLYLTSPDKSRTAFLHASCTEWKNLFHFELFGRTAKIEIVGLGRSYGQEEFRYYQMKPEMGPPDLQVETFPGEDPSWKLEFQAFLNEIKGEKTDIGTAFDALRAVEIVHQTYVQSGLSWVK